MPYHLVYWDISGVCNGACRYCPSGSKNILGNLHKSQAGFLSPKDFRDGLTYLTQKGIINPPGSHIGLYSWGEPYLHPQFEEMLQILVDLNFEYSLSTNASVFKEISKNSLQGLYEIKFSMPGFSQDSYDRQHGFNFETIKDNITKIIESVRRYSDRTKFSIIFHVYRSNEKEIQPAEDFCKKLDIKFDPLWAVLTGFTMPSQVPVMEPSNLRTDMWAEIKKLQPPNWECPQYGILVLDEYSNVVQCCATDRYVPNFVIGNIKDVDWGKVTEIRKNAEVCKPCIESGIGFLAHNCGGAVLHTQLEK